MSFLTPKKQKNLFFSNNSVVNTVASNFTIYTIFDSKELIDEYFNHKLDLIMDIGAFLLIKPQKNRFLTRKC